MNKAIFGNYLPGNSNIHRMNPTAKILATLLVITWILFANNIWNYGLLVAFAAFETYLAQLKLKTVLKAIKPFIWLIMFTVVIQIIFSPHGSSYFSWGPIKITNYGIQLAGLIFIRFVLIIIQATLLTMTTSPNSIASGVEKLIAPLRYVGVPVETIGIMISIALRFVPTLMEELQVIMDAQRSRGVMFNSGGFIKRCKNIISLIIPILVSSFRHADNLADALGASGYEANQPRSSYRQYHWNLTDSITIIAVILLGIAVILMRTLS
ncbi:Energy-coupling factor transporter transmembrane protein EcfT [Fructilactobacillus sanfranciscensis]|uniref:energy-coupling factor transporter transmembrane component T family protein n=1 Tax=Fructilactobacillus sanfranciscensis TaxID=1625 RepID=UPI00385035EB